MSCFLQEHVAQSLGVLSDCEETSQGQDHPEPTPGSSLSLPALTPVSPQATFCASFCETRWTKFSHFGDKASQEAYPSASRFNAPRRSLDLARFNAFSSASARRATLIRVIGFGSAAGVLAPRPGAGARCVRHALRRMRRPLRPCEPHACCGATMLVELSEDATHA